MPFSVAARENLVPVFAIIMIAASGAAIWKLVRRYREPEEKLEPVQVEALAQVDSQAEAAFAVTLAQNKDGTWVIK